jgi:hypothetical protein
MGCLHKAYTERQESHCGISGEYYHDFGCELYMEYGLVNGFIDHLYTSLGTASNYSPTYNLHTLRIATR